MHQRALGDHVGRGHHVRTQLVDEREVGFWRSGTDGDHGVVSAKALIIDKGRVWAPVKGGWGSSGTTKTIRMVPFRWRLYDSIRPRPAGLGMPAYGCQRECEEGCVRIMSVLLFVGLGRIGLPQSLVFAQHGHLVYGYDEDPALIAQLGTGMAPFHEPRLDALLREHVGHAFLPIDDWRPIMGEVDAVMIALGTAAPDSASLSLGPRPQ